MNDETQNPNWSLGIRHLIVILVSSFVIASASADDIATQPTSQPIPPPQLLGIFQRELGRLYRPADADKYLAAHAAMEQYLTNGEQRKAALAQVQASGIAPNILGRLARIRSNWPELTPGGVYYINERVGPLDVHYFLGAPQKYDRTIPWPLVVKLPTADVFVATPRPNADDVQRIYTKWMTEELAHHPDALVIMPLLNLDDLWGPSYAGMNSVIGPIQHVGDRANVDPARVYLIGHGMSGHAAWNLPLHYPTYFAATNPLAGTATADWQRLRLRNLLNLLIVPWQDADDKTLKPDSTGLLVNVMRRFHVEVDFVQSRGVGHVPTDKIADACYDKMMKRTRELYPKEIQLQSNRPETIFNRIDWLQIYQPANGGEEQHMIFPRRPGHMTLMTNTWSADATWKRNHIDVEAENVGVFRIYLNDQMYDSREPVTVTVNGRLRFQAMVTPSVEQMLKDQVFLGRGWRYFTGVIDIDMNAPPPTQK